MIREVARAAGAGALVLLLVGVLIAVTEAAADAARRPVLRICSANIQNTPDLPAWKVRQDAAEVRRSCDVVLWQEIRERADHRALSARGWRTTAYQRGGVPVSWRTARVASMGHASTLRVSRATPRCASGRPSYNPARYVTMKPLRARATGQRFTAVSLHFPQRRTCRNADSRAKWWDAYYNTDRVLPRGPLVVGGDWNRRESEIPDMMRMHWVTAAPRSLDHVFVARTGWRTVGRFRVDLWSDHHATGAVMRLG